jgi:hypothetical protein
MLMELPNTYSGNEVFFLKSQAKHRIITKDVNRKIINIEILLRDTSRGTGKYVQLVGFCLMVNFGDRGKVNDVWTNRK